MHGDFVCKAVYIRKDCSPGCRQTQKKVVCTEQAFSCNRSNIASNPGLPHPDFMSQPWRKKIWVRKARSNTPPPPPPPPADLQGSPHPASPRRRPASPPAAGPVPGSPSSFCPPAAVAAPASACAPGPCCAASDGKRGGVHCHYLHMNSTYNILIAYTILLAL